MIEGRRPARPWGRRIAAALLPCLLAACGTAEPGPQAQPAMWLVADADTRIYLLGTMHALPPGTDWNGGKVAGAIEAADELVMELAPAELAAAGEVFGELAPRATPLAIDARLPQPALTTYRALEASGSDFGGDTLDDWAVVVLMAQRAAKNAGLSSADGVEPGLTARFKAAGKPIRGLETAREQLMLFETLDPATQRTLLTRAAAGSDAAMQDIDTLVAAWTRGDVATLAAEINADIDAVPAARRAIVTERNRRWTAWIAARMARPGTVMVAVGTGHLVGTDSVPAMLEAAGTKVTRVQ